MGRKQPVGYVVRRPLTLWGRRREINEVLKVEEVASLARIESLVRAGRLNPIYDETGRKLVKGRSGKNVSDKVEPVTDKVEPVITKPVKTRRKKVVAEEK